MIVKGFTLVNEDKIKRALDGNQNEHGEFVGGIRKEDDSYNAEELLAEYDKLGGLIRKGEDKVRMGSFFDFKKKSPRAEAKVEFEFRVNGEIIYVPAEEEKPNKVKAVQIAEKAKKEAKK